MPVVVDGSAALVVRSCPGIVCVRREGPHEPKIGDRRVTLYGVARMIAAGAITCTQGRAALEEVGRECGQTEREVRGAIEGGFRAEGLDVA
jgi:hypothetical protein